MKTVFQPTPCPLRQRSCRYLFFGLSLLVACLLGACRQTDNLEQIQTDNLRLTKALHHHLNHGDWKAMEKLYAPTVRYRGRATHFADVDEPKARFLARYRNTLTSTKSSSIEIRQLYPAGAYHVIMEGVARGKPADTALPVCLIYTIEDQHFTRLYAY